MNAILLVMPVSASISSNTTKQYVCNVCGKPFESAETLDSHQRFEHSEAGHSQPLAGVG